MEIWGESMEPRCAANGMLYLHMGLRKNTSTLGNRPGNTAGFHLGQLFSPHNARLPVSKRPDSSKRTLRVKGRAIAPLAETL